MRIGFVRRCLKELETKGLKITSTGRIRSVGICALEIGDGVNCAGDQENMLKNYADEQRRYMLLKRIDENLLKIVFSEIPLQKIKCLLEDKGYDEFCSIFAKRAMLTPEEKKNLFENARAW